MNVDIDEDGSFYQGMRMKKGITALFHTLNLVHIFPKGSQQSSHYRLSGRDNLIELFKEAIEKPG